MKLIVTIPGVAYRIASEGSPGRLAREALDEAVVVKRGRGKQAILVMDAEQATELADYFWSIAGVVGEMTMEERAGGNEHHAAQQAVLRIEAGLRSASA